MVIFIARTAILDWAQLYLIEELDQTAYTGTLTGLHMLESVSVNI